MNKTHPTPSYCAFYPILTILKVYFNLSLQIYFNNGCEWIRIASRLVDVRRSVIQNFSDYVNLQAKGVVLYFNFRLLYI